MSSAKRRRRQTPRRATLAEAIAEAKKILARAEGLDDMPRYVREAELEEPGSIYAADRDVAMLLLARFVEVIEQIDPETALSAVGVARLEREIAERD
jgi:hypothetical protein